MTLLNKTEQLLSTLSIIQEQHKACFSTSFSAEDMLLLDMIATFGLKIEVFTLDTGRLPEETYTLFDTVRKKYQVPINVYFPNRNGVEDYINQHGSNAFYRSAELRQSCCHIRKVEPLARALAGKDAWVTGLRRQQSVTRNNLAEKNWDDMFGIYKFNPLADWTMQEVWAYIRQHDVPFNRLYDQGYSSIGCAPCTRAVSKGEDIRAGRWWWEAADSKECGLHQIKIKSDDAAA